MQATTEQPTLAAVLQRLDRVSSQLDAVLARQRKTEEFFDEMAPVFKEVMGEATRQLDALDKKGYFAFGKELVTVAQRVVEHYRPEDVRQLGDAVVGILDTVRELTQPEVLGIAHQATEVLAHADQAEPIGLLGMVRASRSDEVQKGMAVMMELLRQVGRGAAAVAQKKASADGPRARLAARLGPRRALGIERRPPPRPALPEGPPAPPHAACATPAKPAEVAVVLDGVGFSADGHLADPGAWTRALATTLAAAQGVQLGEGQWKLIDFAREEYLQKKASPNIRRITQATGVPTREIYAMFPKAPGRTIARIAGIPKPTGCL